jgi:ferric-dicitrate binding protein FerR (iron transport regulator)
MTYEAHYGSRAYATLPDGTKVWLNSGSKLTVQPEYQLHERTVELSGEAYFDVETNPERPFIVRVGEISIKATGTVFNVKAYPEEEQITTTLVEGTVFIEGNDEKEKGFKMQLQPNQTVSYRKKITNQNVAREDTAVHTSLPKPEKQEPQKPLTATTSPMKTETLTSWMKDRWIIDNEEFGNLAVQLERRYNVQIRFESEELKQYRFTGTIERETVEQMFDAFRYSIPLKYAIERGIVTLSADVELKKQYEKAWKR